ncbi:MAG: sensor histidine kinase [Robiginitomaculum sp.]
MRGAALWALPLLAVTAFALTWLYRSSTYSIFEEPLVSTVTSLISTAETLPQDNAPTIIALGKEPLDPRYQRALSGRYWQITSPANQYQSEDSTIKSRSLYGGDLGFGAGERAQLLASPGLKLSTNMTGPDGENLRVVARSVILPNMDGPVIMAAAMDQAPAVYAVRKFAVLAVSLMGGLVLGLTAAVLLQVRHGLRPLFDLRDRVADVREGRASEVLGDYPREIAPLARELNSLITHNRDVVERARTHVSNLAHALKTPLAVLTNEADKDKTALGGIVGRQTATMTKQVDHHLARARAASRAQAIGARTDIEKSITDMARMMTRIHTQKDLYITQNITNGIVFRGEKADFDEMIGNLLDNGCKWGKGRVDVTVRPASEPGFVEILVGDDGAGIAPSDYATALARGARLDEAIPGTGFGLSIVDDLARAYKGGVTLGASDMGGLLVTVTLPSAGA